MNAAVAPSCGDGARLEDAMLHCQERSWWAQIELTLCKPFGVCSTEQHSLHTDHLGEGKALTSNLQAV